MSSISLSILITAKTDELLIQQLATAGFDVDVIPFIETKTIQTKETKQLITHIAALNITTVFTSSNAVKAVQDYLENEKIRWKIYCVGNNTKSLIEKTFGHDCISGVANNAAQLAHLIIADKQKEVYFFCGNKRRDELPELLENNKIPVKEIEVYETVVLHHSIKKNYQGILFFSPSAAEGFFKNNVIDATTVLFAIGNTTADILKKFSNNKIVVSNKPGKEELIEKAIEFFK